MSAEALKDSVERYTSLLSPEPSAEFIAPAISQRKPVLSSTTLGYDRPPQ
jgi:hypothetical protein